MYAMHFYFFYVYVLSSICKKIVNVFKIFYNICLRISIYGLLKIQDIHMHRQ